MRSKNCYELIFSYEKLEEFINILPDEKDGEQFYITLFARKKYDTSGLLKCDKNCVKRVTAKKKDIIQKIEQMEVGVGVYTYEGKPIPEEALALYISPNPRSFHLGGVATLKQLVSELTQGRINKNPHSIALNYIQTASENKVYFDVDVDFLKSDDLEGFKAAISNFINLDCCIFIQTRGRLPRFSKTRTNKGGISKEMVSGVHKSQIRWRSHHDEFGWANSMPRNPAGKFYAKTSLNF